MTEKQPRTNITVSYSLPPDAVRAVEYRAYLDRTPKSEAAAKLLAEGAKALGQESPEGEKAQVA